MPREKSAPRARAGTPVSTCCRADSVCCIARRPLTRCLEPLCRSPQAGLAEPLQPGDAVGLLAPNPESEVAALCARLSCDGTAAVTVRANEGGLPSHLPAEPCTVVSSRTCPCQARTDDASPGMPLTAGAGCTGGGPVTVL